MDNEIDATTPTLEEATAAPRSSGLPQTHSVPAPQPINENPIHPVLCHPNGLPKFNAGELIPLKGVTFQVQAVDGMGMVLIAYERIQKRKKKDR